MKNILLLTSVYPADDLPKNNTPVVHYFVKEWVTQGYNVIVIHNKVYYPAIIHFLIKKLQKLIAKYYQFNFPTEQKSKAITYNIEGVNVFRVPIFKWLPQLMFTEKTLKKQLIRIKEILVSEKFSPDFIIGHWPNPQLYQLKHIGEKYNATTCLVMHSDVETIDRMYGKKAREIIENIDIWGFRSKTIKKRFEKLYGKVNRSFLCYSGIPASNIATTQRTFKSGLKNFLFVGQLIPRKYPEVIIKALNIAFKGEDFHVTYIGTGRESENIKKLAKELNISQKVSIYGRVSRDKVFEIMKLSDCFIMLSKPETFGLVYLEAMSMGCITIGSRGEGIDGVIENGKNGFLSEAGNEKKLAELLTKISFLSDKKLIEISDNAIKTAVNLSDEKVARKYIETVVSAQSEQKYGELISG